MLECFPVPDVCVALACVFVSVSLCGALLSFAFCVAGGGPGQRAISQQPKQESLQASGNVFTRQQWCSAPLGHGAQVLYCRIQRTDVSSVQPETRWAASRRSGWQIRRGGMGSFAFNNNVEFVLSVQWGVLCVTCHFLRCRSAKDESSNSRCFGQRLLWPRPQSPVHPSHHYTQISKHANGGEELTKDKKKPKMKTLLISFDFKDLLRTCSKKKRKLLFIGLQLNA